MVPLNLWLDYVFHVIGIWKIQTWNFTFSEIGFDDQSGKWLTMGIKILNHEIIWMTGLLHIAEGYMTNYKITYL